MILARTYETTMDQGLHFFIDEMELTVLPDSFLIQITPVANPPRQDNIKDFPAWTFRSKNAIWFFNEDKPYRYRASHGDKIRQQLLEKLNKIEIETYSA
jgi:hypothetical protein